MTNWADLIFSAINLWTAPTYLPRKCQKRCKLDDSGTYCTGCYRAIEQIKEAGRKKNE